MLGDFSRRYRDVISRAGTACVLFVLLDARGHIGGEFHHFAQAPGSVINRVVIGFEPDCLPAFIHPFELPLEQFALIQAPPEILIGAAVDQCRRAEQTVMFAFQLGEGVTHTCQKVLIGRENTAVEVEFDDRHCPVDRL
ncbi:hypothetical protein D3C78_1428010 [compost metagenome]